MIAYVIGRILLTEAALLLLPLLAATAFQVLPEEG